METTQANWLVVRAHDAKPATAGFPWSLFSTQITALTLTNVSGRLAAVASKSNGAWQVTLFSYDTDGRVATRYTYTQANGGASVLTAVNTTVTYTRDLRDALTQRSLTVGSSTFYQWYDYNNRGLFWKLFASTSSTKPGTADVTDTYRPSGQPQDYQFQGGPLVPIRYTIRDQIARIGDPALTTYPFSARYAYRPNGTVDTAESYSAGSPAAQKRYRYVFGSGDALNRLKSGDFSSWSGSVWTSTLAYDLAGINYDADGNITALQRYRETATLIDNLTYAYPGTSNRLTSVTDAVATTAETWDAETGPFTYDANGNLKAAPAPYSITAVGYDAANLPLSITRSGITTTYRYDGAGQRIAKQVGTGNTEVYILDGAMTLGVFTVNSGGTPTSWYFNLHAGDRVVGRHPNTGSRSYYHSDMLGSTRAVVQGATVVESYDFEPWGLLMPGRTLGSGTKEGFTGKERDAETGLDYFGARYYLPALGRWAAVDSHDDDTPQWSPYNYVNDNPVLHTDPDGRQVVTVETPTVLRVLPDRSGKRDICEGAGNALVCTGWMLKPVQGPLEFAGTLATLPLGGEMGMLGRSGWFARAATGLTRTETAAARSVWSLGWALRGAEIEARLGGNLPAAFPVIDRFAAGVATSIKSVDLAASSYQSGAGLAATLTSYVNKLASFSEATHAGMNVGGPLNPITQKVLQIAVPTLRMTAQQARAFAEAAELAVRRKVQFVVTVVR